MAEIRTGAVPHPLSRSVAEIAGLVIDDFRWHERPLPPVAEPYLHTMLGLGTRDLADHHGHGRVVDVVRGALGGLDDGDGPTADRVKRELWAAVAAAERGAPRDPGGRPAP